jgi:hypothetical protein
LKSLRKKEKFSILGNQRGAILPMVLLAGVLLAGVSYYVISLDEEAEKENLRFKFKQEVEQVVNHINFMLANPANCLLTFGDASQAVNVTNRVMTPNQIVETLDESVIPPLAASHTYLIETNGDGSKGYYDSRVKIKSYRLLSDPDRNEPKKWKKEFILVEIVNKGLLAKDGSNKTVMKRIPIYVEWGPPRDLTTGDALTTFTKDDKRIENCRAVSDSDDQLWSLGNSASATYGETASPMRVGINTIPPTDNNDTRFDFDLMIGDASAPGTGNVLASDDTTSTNFTYHSDAKLKSNIRPIKNALEVVKSLRGVGFNWVNDERKDFGFIAQEVEDELPELVKTSNKTGLKKVDYGKIIPFLVNVFQEQQVKINKLKNRIKKIQK